MHLLIIAAAVATSPVATPVGWHTTRSGIAAAHAGRWTVEVRDIDLSDDTRPQRSRLVATYDVVEGETVRSGTALQIDDMPRSSDDTVMQQVDETTSMSIVRTPAGPVLHVEEQGLLGTRHLSVNGRQTRLPITYATRFDIPLVAAGADRLAGSYDMPTIDGMRPIRRIYVMTPAR